MIVEADTHVKDDVWMTQLIEHLYLLNEIFESLLCHVAFAKLLHCDFGAEPARLEYITITTPDNKIRLRVYLKLFKVYIEVKSVLLECINKARFLAGSHGRLWISPCAT